MRTDRSANGSGQVRVTPQLIRVSDDTHLWSDRYTASLAPGEIFAVQANIAEQVTTALNVALLGPEREALRDAPTSDPAAHEAYLLGRFHWNKRTRDGLARAAEHFTTAADADSTFAGAWAGLADSYVLWPLYGVTTIPRAEAYARAKAAARRAIALDSVLAEAHRRDAGRGGSHRHTPGPDPAAGVVGTNCGSSAGQATVGPRVGCRRLRPDPGSRFGTGLARTRVHRAV